MEIYFNELTLNNIRENFAVAQLGQIGAIYRELRRYKIKTCRIESVDYNLLQQILQNTRPEMLGIVYSFFQCPYQDDKPGHGEEYLAFTWLYNDSICQGLAYAYIMESMALSIDNEIWDHAVLNITQNGTELEVRNIATIEHCNYHQDFLESLLPLELITTDVPAWAKVIHLRHDHGENLLRKLADLVVQSPYVVSVINSLPFNPHERKFIRNVDKNGQIEIVMIWTDEGYGMVIQTTGRNQRETEAIANEIEKRYNRPC